MKDTNQLHKEHCYNSFGAARVYPKSKQSLANSKGLTKKITQTEAALLMKDVKNGKYQGAASVVIEFTDEKEANKIAKSFIRLAENPGFKLDVTFKKIITDETKN